MDYGNSFLSLGIDASVYKPSVAVSCNGVLLDQREVGENRIGAELLLSLIDGIIVDLKIDFSVLSSIAVATGPGSFTGIRSSLATAHGLISGGLISGGLISGGLISGGSIPQPNIAIQGIPLFRAAACFINGILAIETHIAFFTMLANKAESFCAAYVIDNGVTEVLPCTVVKNTDVDYRMEQVASEYCGKELRAYPLEDEAWRNISDSEKVRKVGVVSNAGLVAIAAIQCKSLKGKSLDISCADENAPIPILYGKGVQAKTIRERVGIP